MPTKSPGPDEQHPRFKRNLLYSWLYLYKFLENFQTIGSFLTSGKLLMEYNYIFKKGSRKSPSDYRPKSLTSVTCKVFEFLIHDAIMGYEMGYSLSNNMVYAKEILCHTIASALENWTVQSTLLQDKAFDCPTSVFQKNLKLICMVS